MEKENTEQLILKAAEKEFLEKGFAGAKTVSIAKAAGVNHALLHYYFRTKENLFNRVFNEKFEEIAKSLPPLLVNKETPLTERIEKFITNHFEYLRQNPRLPHFIINEICTNPERRMHIQEIIGKVFSFYLSQLQIELDEMAERGQISRISAVHLLLDIVSLNVFTFTMLPILEPFVTDSSETRESFFEERKQDILNLILNRLKPQLQ